MGFEDESQHFSVSVIVNFEVCNLRCGFVVCWLCGADICPLDHVSIGGLSLRGGLGG